MFPTAALTDIVHDFIRLKAADAGVRFVER